MSMMAPILLLLFCLLVNTSFAGFTEIPQTRNVTAGVEAEFRCQHSNADFIGWRVNNTSVERSSLTGISQDHGTLTILALPEYNGTVVECVALYFDGSTPELTPPAYLIVEGNCNTTIAIAFIEEPQSQNVAIGETAKFRCRHPTANYIGWRVNGTSLNNFNLTNISATSIPLPDGHSRYVLLIGAIPTYNGTIVICVAKFLNQCPLQESGPAVLLIQGPLLAVSVLVRGFISDQTFSWNPPPTLDLTNVEPDIAYCVIIHNITCGRKDFLIGDCSLTDPFYIYEDIHPGHVYKVEVIPRSNVERAANGTPLSVEESFINFQVTHINLIKEVDSLNMTVVLEISPNTSNSVSGYRIVPDKYHVVATAADGVDKLPTTISRMLQGDVHNATFKLEGKRIWRYEFLAYGCTEHTLGNITISTHDAYNISVTSPHPGGVVVTGNMISGSSAKGVLIIVYSLTNDSEVLYITSKAHQQDVNATITNLKVNNGSYGVAVFTLEGNGLPFSRVAALPQVVQYKPKAGAQEFYNTSAKIKYKLLPNLAGVCVNCTFLDSSTADCVAVVHQRISQLSSSGLTNIESSNKFNRSGDTAYGCIEGVNLSDVNYQVGVVNGEKVLEESIDTKGVSPRPSSTIVTVVVVFLGVLMVMTTITVVVVLVTCRCNHMGFKSMRRIGNTLDQPVNAVYLYEVPSHNVVAPKLCLLQPYAAKWRIVATAFGLSPESVGIHETDEAYLEAILMQSVNQSEFQLKFDTILNSLKEAEADEEAIKQDAGVTSMKEDKSSGNSAMESTVGSAGRAEQIIVTADQLPTDNSASGAQVIGEPSKGITTVGPVSFPVQESGSSAKEYKGVVKKQLKHIVQSTDANKKPDDLDKEMARDDSPPENADINGVTKSVKPYSESVHRLNRAQQTYRSGDDQQSTLDGHQEHDKEQSRQADGIPFPQHHPPFDEEDELQESDAT